LLVSSILNLIDKRENSGEFGHKAFSDPEVVLKENISLSYWGGQDNAEENKN
jgi:hypothetical protein